jgi:hypothetical protein
MNKQEKILAYVVIGIVGLTGIVIGVNSQIADADLTQGEVYNYITSYTSDNADVFDRLISNSDTVEDLEDAIRLLEDDHNDVLNDLEESTALALATIRNEIAQLKIDVAILNAGGYSGGSGGSSSGDFNLESCTDYNCTDETSRFDQGETVYVRGHNPSNDRSLEYKVYDPDNNRLDSRNVSMQPNGPFIIAYQISNNAIDGSYRLEVEIDNDQDTINFIVD